MSNTKYTNEFKFEVISYYLNNHTVKETLSHYSISESALFAWKRKSDAKSKEFLLPNIGLAD